MKLEELTNAHLLSLYDLMVRVDHYDPVQTPEQAALLLSLGITHETIHGVILRRMNTVHPGTAS